MDERKGMKGSGEGTDGAGPGTSGWHRGISGLSPAALRRLLFGMLIAYAFVQAAANIASSVADDRRHGGDLTTGFAALYELSSLAGWLVLLMPIWWASVNFRPPRFSWPVALALHAAMTVPVSLGHVAIMFAIRFAVFAALGMQYDVGALSETLLYEYRKDAASYVLLALAMAAVHWLVERQAAAQDQAQAPADAGQRHRLLTLGDGPVQMRVPLDEIDLLEAAGNYVEVHWGGRQILHRATLSSLERELAGAGFVRIHRSRIVRSAAIRRIHGGPSGDFIVTLADGRELRGSRRYRAGLRG